MKKHKQDLFACLNLKLKKLNVNYVINKLEDFIKDAIELLSGYKSTRVIGSIMVITVDNILH